MFVTQCIRRHVMLTPDKPALVFGDRTTTYGELRDRVARCAGGLMQFGLGPGERVTFLGLNSDRSVELMFGSIWAGYVPNYLNVRWAIPELVYAINDSGASVLAFEKQFAARVAPLREQCPSLKHFVCIGEDVPPEGIVSYEAMVAHSLPVEDQCTDPNAMAVLNYTGGTTGMSKGVMLTHVRLMATASVWLLEVFVPGQTMAFMLPGFHIGGIVIPLCHLLLGNTIGILPAYAPLEALKLFQEQRIEQVFVIPTMIQMMIDHPDFAKYDLSSLKRVSYGGAPMSEALVRRVREKLPHVQFLQAYGQTEGLPATVLPVDQHTDGNMAKGRLKSVGRPALGCEVKIVDANDIELAPMEIGEIAIRGAHIMSGYWNKPELTATTLRGGWLHTGDAGYMDRDGYLYLVDRVKDMIITGGENVYSTEVENALAKHPAVATCAVIAIPDDKWGERVHAVVVLRPGMKTSEEDLQAHCRELIANYKLPRSFAFSDALPLTAVGKVNKVALREPHWQGRQYRVS